MFFSRTVKFALLGLCFFVLTWPAIAQDQQAPAATPPTQSTPGASPAQSAPVPPAETAPAATPAAKLLRPEELEALVAPIALYPDNLLSLVLMASTYPVDVVQGDRWVKDNKKLKGEALKAAVDKQSWDDSVKSLVAAPDVLDMMSSKLDWTVKLGQAVVAQQADVMDAIQRLRAKADARNKLTSTKEQKVTKIQDSGKTIIAIEPTDPDMLYVPYYDPAVMYGEWPYAEYPPYYWGYPGYIPGALIATGLAFGAGWALNNWRTGGVWWGGGVNWGRAGIIANRPRVNPLGGNNWQHRPNAPGAGLRPGGGQRPSIGQLPAGGRPGGGLGAGSGRPSAGQLPARGKPGAGQRPGGGRHHAAQRPSHGRGGLGNARQGARVGHRANVNRGAFRGGGGRSFHGGGGRAFRGGGGGGFRGGGGGGFRGGGGGGRGGGGRGGGRRSDITVKHDVVLLGHLANGLGYYRFSYNGSERAYVGVIAQEVQQVTPQAVVRDRHGYLRVYYDKIGVKFQSYEHWLSSGAQPPSTLELRRSH